MDKATLNNILTGIAQKELGIETLAARCNDSQDFHELSVWSIRKALEAAFEVGKMAK